MSRLAAVPARLATVRGRVSPFGMAAAAALALVAAFYLWTAETSIPFHFDRVTSGRYGDIADSLAHGQLSMRGGTPEALAALPNPYDPQANLPWRAGGLQDLSLHDGKLYAPWGPTPALVAFLPLRVLGIFLPQSLAAAVFGFLGLLFWAATLRLLVRRFAPAAPTWALSVGVAALALSNVVPFALRRPIQYEVALTSGLCFTGAGVGLLLSGWFRERRSLRRIAAGSLCLGLAVGCRPTLGVLWILPLALAFLARGSSGRSWVHGDRGRLALALFAPLVACGLVLAAYNVGRFGSPLEFGATYQLAGVDQRQRSTFDPAYLPPGLFYYALAPPRPTILFPFLRLPPPPSYPGHVPAVYDSVEPTGGVLPMVPLLLALVALPFAARRWSGELRVVAGALVAAGVAMLAVTALVFWGTTERYEIDFVTPLLVGALLVWFTALQGRRRGWARRLIAVSGTAAAAWGALAGLAVSTTGYYDLLRANRPQLWGNLERTFSPVSRLMGGVAGRPVVAEVSAPLGADAPPPGWGRLGAGVASFSLAPASAATLRVVTAAGGPAVLAATASPGPGARPGGRIVLRVATDRGSRDVALTAARRVDVPIELAGGIDSVVITARAAGVAADAPVLRLDRVYVLDRAG